MTNFNFKRTIIAYALTVLAWKLYEPQDRKAIGITNSIVYQALRYERQNRRRGSRGPGSNFGGQGSN